MAQNPFVPSYITPGKPQQDQPTADPELGYSDTFEFDFEEPKKPKDPLWKKGLDLGIKGLGYADMLTLRPHITTGLGEAVDFGRKLLGKEEVFTNPKERWLKGQSPSMSEVLRASGVPDHWLTSGIGFAGDVLLGGPTSISRGVAKQVGKSTGVLKTGVDKAVQTLGKGDPNVILKTLGGTAKLPARAVDVASAVAIGPASKSQSMTKDLGELVRNSPFNEANYIIKKVKGASFKREVGRLFNKYDSEIFDKVDPQTGVNTRRTIDEAINDGIYGTKENAGQSLISKISKERDQYTDIFDKSLADATSGVFVRPKIFTKANNKSLAVIRDSWKNLPKGQRRAAKEDIDELMHYMSERHIGGDNFTIGNEIHSIKDFMKKKEVMAQKAVDPNLSGHARTIWKKMYGIYANAIRNAEEIAVSRMKQTGQISANQADEMLKRSRELTGDLDSFYKVEQSLGNVSAKQARGWGFGFRPVANMGGGVSAYASGTPLPNPGTLYELGRGIERSGNIVDNISKQGAFSAARKTPEERKEVIDWDSIEF